VDEAHTLMQHYHIRHLPVVERGRLVGIVSDRDIRLVLPSPATSLAVHELRYLLAHLTVREIMQHPVLTIKLESPLTAAVRLMLQHHIDALPVVAHGRLLGILTRSDILQEFVTLQTGLPVAA
jgi:acetoin utilization protein AcuB